MYFLPMVILGHAVFAVDLGPADKRSCIVNGLLGMLHVEFVEKGVVCPFLLAMIRGLQHAVSSEEKLKFRHEYTHLFSQIKYIASGSHLVVTIWNLG
jgi:hypothetical protein